MPATPIADGVARANWRVALGGSQPQDEIPSGVSRIPGHRHELRRAAVSSINAVGNGLAVLKGYKLGQLIYIFNNIPYVKYLNEGTSRQAPAGFIEATRIKVRETLGKTQLLRKRS